MDYHNKNWVRDLLRLRESGEEKELGGRAFTFIRGLLLFPLKFSVAAGGLQSLELAKPRIGCRGSSGGGVGRVQNKKYQLVLVSRSVYFVSNWWLIRPLKLNKKYYKKEVWLFGYIPVGRTDGRTDKSCQKLQQRRRKTVWRLWQLFLPQIDR